MSIGRVPSAIQRYITYLVFFMDFSPGVNQNIENWGETVLTSFVQSCGSTIRSILNMNISPSFEKINHQLNMVMHTRVVQRCAAFMTLLVDIRPFIHSKVVTGEKSIALL